MKYILQSWSMHTKAQIPMFITTQCAPTGLVWVYKIKTPAITALKLDIIPDAGEK